MSLDTTSTIILAVVLPVGVILLLILGKIKLNGQVCKETTQLHDQVVIVTGANVGIGKETAKELAKRGATVILASRDATKTQDVVQEIIKLTNNPKVDFIRLDLSDLASVKTFAEEFKAKYNKLNILINNAGVMLIPKRQTTKQGFEMQIGVNHFGHLLLVNLLTDTLLASKPSRIVQLSSDLHLQAKLELDNINLETGYDQLIAYNNSKLANCFFAREFNTLYESQGVKAVALHPGVVRTELSRYFLGNLNCVVKVLLAIFVYPIWWYFTRSVWYGCQTSLYCALVPFEKLKGGAYYANSEVSSKIHKDLKSPASSQDSRRALVAPDVSNDKIKKFWEISQMMLREKGWGTATV